MSTAIPYCECLGTASLTWSELQELPVVHVYSCLRHVDCKNLQRALEGSASCKNVHFIIEAHELSIENVSPKTDHAANPDTGEIQAILARRKRLLTELFFLSKYIDVSQTYDNIDGAARARVDSEDLAVFLAENDLSSDKLFREDTLPDVCLEPVDASTQLDLSKNISPDATPSDDVPHGAVVTSGTTGSGILVDDASVQDAEIAKASLLGHPVVHDDIAKPMELNNEPEQKVVCDDAIHKTKLVVVEPLPKICTSEFDLSAWLLDAKSKPLLGMVQVARKNMSTANWSAALAEHSWIRTSERIEELKMQNQWSLRQPMKQKSAPRRKAHWDFLIDEMQWMRTDFREERKWKMALAYNIAHAVKAWHDSADKDSLIVHPAPIVYQISEEPGIKESSIEYEPPTPPSGSDDIFSERLVQRHQNILHQEQLTSSSPMVFSPPLSTVDDTMHVFDIGTHAVYAYLADENGRGSPSLLPDMPVYAPPVPTEDNYTEPLDCVPLINPSKYAQSKIIIRASKKRSAGEINQGESVKINPEHPTASSHSRKKSAQIALAIRPPVVPSSIDRRKADRKDHAIIWTNEADDMLLNLLYEYQYNWDFVAQAMSPTTLVCAVADRKSPWDCFERWVQIDPRSTDVVFTGAHARLVQSRVDDMVRTPRPIGVLKRSLSAIQKSQQVEPKKQRQFSLFDAMRKVQRKRENQPKAALPKKTLTDATKTPPVVPTPQHLSQMKFERDQQIARAFLESKNQQMQALQQQRLMQQQQQQHQQHHQQQQQQQQQQSPHHQQQQQQQHPQQKVGPQPTQAQIAQIQAARQTQHRAQLAQHAAQAAAAGGSLANGSGPNTPLGRAINQAGRPALPGQMPSRPTSATGLVKGMANTTNGQVPNPALLRIPPGQRLSQEQMNQLLQQARLQKGMSATPSPGVHQNGHQLSPHPLPGGHYQMNTAVNGVATGANGALPSPGAAQSSAPGTPVAGLQQVPVATPSTPVPQNPGLPKELPTEKAR